MSAAAVAADAPKLVGEKEILRLDDKVVCRMDQAADPIYFMRLSPDGRRLLYLRWKMYQTTMSSKEGKVIRLRKRRGYKIVLRDLKTGKDTEVPVPAINERNIALFWLSMTVFDSTGKTLAVPVGKDDNKNDFDEESERCNAGLYDIATGKVKVLDIEAHRISLAFHPDGKRLVVMASEGVSSQTSVKVCVTDIDKIQFIRLSKTGVPRSISPTSGLMVMLLFADRHTGWKKQSVIFDMTSDRVKAKLPDRPPPFVFMIFNPQWAADGRHLYHVAARTVERPGKRSRQGILTRIWNAKTGKEAGLLTGMTPIGPGPKNTMVLVELQSERKKLAADKSAPKPKPKSQIVLHAQDDKTLGKKLHPLGDMSTYPISTQGKWLLYIRKDATGAEAVCMAEIKLP